MSKKSKKNIFDFEYMDDDERRLIESIEKDIESGAIKPLTGAQKKESLGQARVMARNTLAKNARVNIRMNQNDLRGLKAKAAAEGMPYQTLLSCLVHKYVSGQIRFTLS